MSYQFVCRDCRKQFEIVGDLLSVNLLKITCPNCKSMRINRKYTMPSVHFKGKGWGGDKE